MILGVQCSLEPQDGRVSTRQRPSLWPANPLTPYDVLGYLAPGATFLLSLYGFEFWIHHAGQTQLSIHTPVYTLIRLSSPPPSEGGWALATAFLISLFGGFYVL